ncbi:hypothetical protein [Brevundimonas sp.]|uniref:hypothetical protein n=1 Tax=Brevundimonas sp. TaxID=1871086 RepID=UPI0026166B71|nr:hypothetical protein [Brevundimonas sp.]
MARFSIGTAIGEGFGLVRRRPFAVLVWGLLMAVPSVASLALVLPMLGGMFASMASGMSDPEQVHNAMMADMAQVQDISSLLNLVQLVVMVVVYTAVMRAVVRPRETAFFSLRLGMDELRVAVVGLALTVGICLGALVFVLLGVGIGFATWGLGEPYNWLIIVALCLGFVLAIWLGTARVSLIASASVLHRTFAFEQGWKLGRGRTGALFGMMLVLVLIMLVAQALLVGIGSAVFMAAAGGMDWSRILTAIEENPVTALTALFNANWPWVTLAGLVVAALHGVIVTLSIAPFASACRQLSAEVAPAAEEGH